MRQYKHRGCESVMYTYVGYGDGPSSSSSGPMSKDWLMSNGEHPRTGSSDTSVCPDCKQRVSIFRTSALVALDGKPFFGTWDRQITPKIPTHRSLWQRIKDFFTKG
jgi:hypothetical protein